MLFHFVIDIVSFFNEEDKLRENTIVVDDSCELREVPRVPLLESHAESIDVFVQLLNERDGLHNWFVLPVHVGRTFLAGVGVTQTQLRSFHIVVLNLFHDLDEVSLDSSLELSDGLVERSCDSSFLEDPIVRLVRLINTRNRR